MYYNVKLDNTDVSTIGWRVATIPVITHSTQNRDRFTIPARDGELLGSDVWRNNAFVTVSFHTRVGNASWGQSVSSDTMDDRINRLYTLLTGKQKLNVSIQAWSDTAYMNDAGYYEILGYNISSETRVGRDYARIEVQFEVYPFKFRNESPDYTDLLSVQNNYDEAMPLYVFNLNSTTSDTISVNGHTMTVYKPPVQGIYTVYIDVRKQMAYYINNNVKYENIVAGDYRGLVLPAHATSTIVLSGGTVRTYPRRGQKI